MATMLPYNSPTFALDFTSASLDSRVTFTRATSASNPATYVNSGGIVTAATDNQPRFDYDPITLACKGLLVEESRTNRIVYSESISGSTWTVENGSVTSTNNLSPFTANNASVFTENAANGQHGARNTSPVTYSLATVVTASVFLKVGTRQHGFLALYNGTSYESIVVNLATGDVTSTSTAGLTYSTRRFANGFVRLTLTRTQATTTSTYLYWGCSNSATPTFVSGRPSYAGTNGQTIIAVGAQLEAGNFVTSYIPTTTTALTRNADVATITGTNFSDWWKAGLGGAAVQALPSTVSGTRPLVQFDDGTANEIIALRGNTTNPELYVVDGGSPQAQIDAGTIAENTAYTLTGWWQTNFCAARKDGGARVEDLTATIPTVTQARLGSDGTNYLNGHIATVGYYDKFSGQIYTRRKNKVVFTVI